MKNPGFKTKTAPALGIALALSASALQSDAAIQTVQYSASQPKAKTEISYFLTIPKFNLALGGLLQIDIHFATALDSIDTILNSGSASSSGEAKTEVQLRLQDPSKLIIDDVSYQIDKNLATKTFSNLTAGGQMDLQKTTGSDSVDLLYTVGDNLDILTEFSHYGL